MVITAGIDFKLFGEFVKGIDSWISLGFMKSEEDLVDDFYYEYYNAEGEQIIPGFTFDDEAVDSTRIEPGFIPRPTDQRFRIGIFLPGLRSQNSSTQSKPQFYLCHWIALWSSNERTLQGCCPNAPVQKSRYWI